MGAVITCSLGLGLGAALSAAGNAALAVAAAPTPPAGRAPPGTCAAWGPGAGPAGVRVGQVYFNERYAGAEQRVAQRNAGVREGARVDDHERHSLGAGPMDAIDQLVFGVTLERDQLVPELAGNRRRALLDRLECVGAIHRRFPGPEQIEVRSEERRVGKECRSRWSPYH